MPGKKHEKINFAGNFAMVHGLDYNARKSLTRDKDGFEPLEGYFDQKWDGEETLESDTDESCLGEERYQRELSKLREQRKSTKSVKVKPAVAMEKERLEVVETQERDAAEVDLREECNGQEVMQQSVDTLGAETQTDDSVPDPVSSRTRSGLRAYVASPVNPSVMGINSPISGIPMRLTFSPDTSVLDSSEDTYVVVSTGESTPRNIVRKPYQQRRSSTSRRRSHSTPRRLPQMKSGTQPSYQEPAPVCSSGDSEVDQDGSTILSVDNSFHPETVSTAISKADPVPVKYGKGDGNATRSTILKHFNITMSGSEGSDTEDNITQMLLGKNLTNRQLLSVSRLMETRQVGQPLREAGQSDGAETGQVNPAPSSSSPVVRKGPSRAARRKTMAGMKRKQQKAVRDKADGSTAKSGTDTVVKTAKEFSQPPPQTLAPKVQENRLEGEKDSLLTEGPPPFEEPSLVKDSMLARSSILSHDASALNIKEESGDSSTHRTSRAGRGRRKRKVSFSVRTSKRQATAAHHTDQTDQVDGGNRGDSSNSDNLPVKHIDNEETGLSNNAGLVFPETPVTDEHDGFGLLEGSASPSTILSQSTPAGNDTVNGNVVSSPIILTSKPPSASKTRSRRKRKRVTMPNRTKPFKRRPAELDTTIKPNQRDRALSENNQATVSENVESKKSVKQKGSKAKADGVVMDGGRKYREIVLKPRDNITPGVRRSTRMRLPPIRPYDLLKYDYHWGTTPSRKVGPELRSVLERVTRSEERSVASQRIHRVTEIKEEEQVLFHQGPDGETLETRIVTPPSLLEPTNIDGNMPGPGDDVFIYRFLSNQFVNVGIIVLKRYAEKPRSKSGANLVVFRVEKGRVEVTVNGKEFLAQQGSQITIPPGCVYSLANIQTAVASIYYIIMKNS